MRNKVLITVAVVALALGSTGSWHWWNVLRFRQSTDDAYIQSDVSVISPKIEGYLKKVRVADNQEVEIALPKRVQVNPQLKSTPVIMLSSKDGVFDRARGRLAGSDRYLTKPFTKEGLIEAVNEYVKPASLPT